ncbi:MAG TPA: ABC transporter ATP-binding protein [Chthoniobacteraceae bacterium]|nr:cmpD 2 [Chthoniobacter sp.]HEV7869282.1 ABC transporter ATP-binding protein [Chthoniobacteraceae bacterium]
MSFLELNNVHKGFGPANARTEVLRDIELRIEEGEFVAIVGYSGAGKTTLISLVAGLIRPDMGKVKLKGVEITEPGPDRGVVFQNYSLLPWLTVFENIQLAVDQVFPKWSEEQKRAHIDKYIATVNLTPAREKKPSELSGGMRQRVSVARALATEPQILLLDEPLGALDALTRATLQDEIVRIWEQDKRTVVMITNDVDEGIMMADRIVPLSAGPNATLGPSVAVNIPRPRDRKAINHDPEYKEVRRQVIGYLLGEGGKQRTAVSRKLILPDLLPEDLSEPRTLYGTKRKPRRRSETKREQVEVEA